jgi:hypothetical protein
MSYNYNVNDNFYDPNQTKNQQYGNTPLNFASATSAASVSQQFYDPTSFYSPPAAAAAASQVNQQQGYYQDWSQQQSFFNPVSQDKNDPFSQNATNTPTDFENEPPLLEELGINFDHIYRKTKCVLNPFAKPHETIIHDEDLAGPLVFCIAYGFSLLLVGKIQFGYIYGITALGCLSMYMLLNLMSEQGVSAICIGSTLGYCLLPMIILSFISSVLTLNGIVGLILSVFFILWCSISSSKLFVNALNMTNQQMLVLYPCFLLYGIFALLNVF